jgi:hypothetical protein
MSADTSTSTGLEILEALDFAPEYPCGGMTQERPCPRESIAELLIAVLHSGNVYPVCRQCWAEDGRFMAVCPTTLEIEGRDDHYRIVQVLR